MSIHALAAYGIFILPVMMIAERRWLGDIPMDEASNQGGSVNADNTLAENCAPLLSREDSQDPPIEHLGAQRQRQRRKRFAIRLSISLFCVLVACAFPFFADVQSLIGATTSSLLTFILPIAFYIYLRWEHVSPASRWSLLSICVFMTLLAFIAGTIASVLGIIDSASSYSVFPLCYQCKRN